MLIIGITGTNGAGKGTLAEYLVSYKNFSHFSVRAFLTEEVERRGLPVNRDTLIEVGNDLRKNNSPSYIAEKLYEKAKTHGRNSIIESIRTEGEVVSLKNRSKFYLFAIDAGQRTRYDRLYARKSETDKISFEEFRAQEEREMHSDDPNKQNLFRCIELADFIFLNNGKIDDLHSDLEAILVQINI